MLEPRPCPNCGCPVPIDADPGPSTSDPSTDLPPVSLLAPGSDDDNFPGPRSGGGPLRPADPAPRAGRPARPPSSGNFPALNIDTRVGPRADGSTRVDLGPSDSGDEFEPEARRPGWGPILLASYASAVTLALGWTLWKARGRESPRLDVAPPPSAVAVVPESARQAGLSRKVEPPEPLLGDHLAAIGRPLKVGSLEVTPVEVRRQDVALQRSNPYATPQRREGGKRALVLRLRLKNTSADTVFAPLDPAYLRERGKGVVDTFVQTAGDERVYPFPLALDSEWSIVGQDLTELRPGESRVVAIPTAPDAPPDSAGPFTWRVRLRTGIDRTDAIGVRWPADPAPPR